MKDKELEITAYHEAGHAVMAIFHKRQFRFVTIDSKEKEGVAGFVRYEPFGISQPVDSRIRIKYERQIMITLAGPAAEYIFTGNYELSFDVAETDFKNTYELTSRICDSENEELPFVSWLNTRTNNILKDPAIWPCVEALAEELLKVKRLNYRKARELVLNKHQEREM